jgi:hypothetical protein
MNIKNISTRILISESKRRKKVSENYKGYGNDFEINEILLDEILEDKDTINLIYNELTRGDGKVGAVEVLMNLLERGGYTDLMTYEDAEAYVSEVSKEMGIMTESKKKKKTKRKKARDSYYPYGLVGGWRYWDNYDREDHAEDVGTPDWGWGDAGGGWGGGDGGGGD